MVRALASCLVGRCSCGSNLDLKIWNLLQSGQALGIMTVAGKFSNADAIFIGVRSCCLLPSHRNNLHVFIGGGTEGPHGPKYRMGHVFIGGGTGGAAWA